MAEKQFSRLCSIGYFIGYVIAGIGLLQWIPLLTSVIYREWDIVYDFMISSSVALLTGGCLTISLGKYRFGRLSWGEGMAVAAGSWLVGMLISAVPYYLSGNYLSYLDAAFDVMSGFTTTGLVLIQNLDHVSNGINMWRHLITFVGGQGMVVLALTFLGKGTFGAYKMYVGEAKDEKLMPNAVNTARYIWIISLFYLIVGTFTLFIAGLIAGLPADRSILHGLWIFMSAWSTGGFAPMSQNVLYYHSAFYEIITLIFFIIGSLNFALHYSVLTGRKKELLKDIETVSFTITVSVLILIATLGLMQNNVYPNAIAMFRKGFYHIISGHTTTGLMSVYAAQLYNEWGDIALFAIITAMLIGGSACSTAGGFKGLRMGIIYKAFKRDVNRLVLPESMVTVQKIHHVKDSILDDNTVRSALLVVIAYISTFAIGMLFNLLYGYPFSQAAFEAASITGNVGLSSGLTSAAMPSVLKVVYIIIMWVARLEFMSVLSLGAYFAMKVKRKCQG